MNPLKFYKTLAGILQSNVSPAETAVGVLLAMFLGFTPLNGPFGLVLFVVFIILRLSSISTFFTFPLFKLLYVSGLSRLTDAIGSYLLINASFLKGFWRFFVNLPIIAYLDINNTLVLGGIVLSLVLSIPVYFLAREANILFRKHYADKTKGLKLFQWLASANLAPAAPAAPAATKFKAFISRLNTAQIIKWVVILIVIQFGVGFVVSPFLSSFLIKQISKNTPAKISIDRVNIWPLTLSFSMKGLKIFDPQNTAERLIWVQGVSMRVSPLGLLSKRIVVAEANLNDAEISLKGMPDGSFNIQNLGKPAQEKPAAPLLETFQKKKDLFGRAYDLLKKRSSKKAVSEAKTQQKTAKLTTTQVTNLPHGKRVDFKRGRDLYLLEIRGMDLKNVTVHVKSESGQTVDLDKARIKLAGLGVDPENAVHIDSLHLAAGIAKEGKPAGRVELTYSKRFSQNALRTELDSNLKDVDLAAVSFIYEDSLPVSVPQGTLNLRSLTSIVDEALDSKTSLSIKDAHFAPKSGMGSVSGLVTGPVLCEALNTINPVNLNFDIKGTVENPEFSGFKDSVMNLVKPSLANVQEKVKSQAAGFLSNLLKGKGVAP